VGGSFKHTHIDDSKAIITPSRQAVAEEGSSNLFYQTTLSISIFISVVDD
jgi:hypothetical protein